jgi:hypothetical protein
LPLKEFDADIEPCMEFSWPIVLKKNSCEEINWEKLQGLPTLNQSLRIHPRLILMLVGNCRTRTPILEQIPRAFLHIKYVIYSFLIDPQAHQKP